MFTVGQKIVCVNDDFSNLKDSVSKKYVKLPRKGEQYTIREITAWGILLEEIKNEEFMFLKHNNMITEPSFSPSRFVPLLGGFRKLSLVKWLRLLRQAPIDGRSLTH